MFVIPACRESFRSISYIRQYSNAKKDSGHNDIFDPSSRKPSGLRGNSLGELRLLFFRRGSVQIKNFTFQDNELKGEGRHL